MLPAYLFFAGLAITAGFSFAVVWYLKSHLRGILIDLCGTERRADFWMAFSNVVLILVPLVFAMEIRFPTAVSPAESGSIPIRVPADNSIPPLSQLIYQLKWSFSGLVASMLALGVIVSRYIPRNAAGAEK